MAAPTVIPRSVYYDGTVTEKDRAEGRAGAPDFTVYGPDDLRLSAHPTIPFALVVRKGKASAFGVTAFVETDTGGNLTVQCDTNSSGTRWDLISIRYDWRPESGGPSDIRAINAGVTAQIPPIENTPGSIVDQPTWLVRWTGNASAPAEYIDLRCWAANGGVEAAHRTALQYLTRPGAAVKIGTEVWRYEKIVNEQWQWRAYVAAPIIRGGTTTRSTNGNGDGTILFSALPSIVSGVSIVEANPGIGAATLKVLSYNTESINFRAYATLTGEIMANANIRIAYTAIGY